MPSSRIGSQSPRLLIEPRRADTDGPDAAALTAAYGFELDPWQRLVLDSWLGRSEDDRYVATSCGLSVPRQNGKNAILEARELYGIAIIGEKILHTAHRVDTARKSFLRLLRFFEDPKNGDLADLVLSVRKTNGQEAIFLKNGGAIEFSSRVNGGARGSTYDAVVFDEAQWLTDEQMESIMSTMAAAPLGNRQLIYTGTPPDPGSPGTIFANQRANALKGADKRLAWFEWSVEEMGDIADKDRWYEANPGLGIRLEEEFTETECATLSPDGFARERLGWWSGESGANPALKKARWEACAIEEAAPPDEDDRVAYGVKFTPDGGSVALSAAVRNPKRKALVECIDFRLIVNGVGSLAKWLLDRKGACSVCVIDGKSNAAALEQKLKEGGFPRRAIKVCSPNDVSAAASMLSDAVDAGEVEHVSPTDLDRSAIAAQKRPIGANGGWGFGSGAFDCAPIESASLAYWGAMTTKRRPGRKARAL